MSSVAQISLVNLGCRVNRSEADRIALMLEEQGATIVDGESAAIVIINTCAVTAEAQAQARQVIRRFAREKSVQHVIATGCAIKLFEDEFRSLDEKLLMCANKELVVDLALNLMSGMSDASSDVTAQSTPLESTAPTPTGRLRPGIKVQDGCDRRCSFCLVWKARGAARSLPFAEVLDEVQAAEKRGAHELVLTGIDLGSYDAAVPGKSASLAGLLEALLEETSIERFRISSIEPESVDDELLELMAHNPSRIAAFLHICLQSGSDRTLARMNRGYSAADFRAVCGRVRAAVPHISLGTDVICGFPGETDEDHVLSLAFCEEMKFSRMHVFRYSKRPGTPAAEDPDQLDPKLIAARSRELRTLAVRLRAEQAAALSGTRDYVLVQEPGQGISGGLFDVKLDPRLPTNSFLELELFLDESGSLTGRP